MRILEETKLATVRDLDQFAGGNAGPAALTSILKAGQIDLAESRGPLLDPCDNVYAKELEIARDIQQSLLPKRFPALPGFGLSGFCLSSRQVGGDFYYVLPL